LFIAERKIDLINKLTEGKNQIIEFDTFKKSIDNILKNSELSTNDIDCVYIYLCRGIKGKFVKEMVNKLENHEIS